MIEFRHFCFIVSDISKSISFYKRFGLKSFQRKRIRGVYVSALFGDNYFTTDLTYAKLYIGNKKNILELIQFHNPKVKIQNQSHLALSVDNLMGLYSKFIKLGVKFISPPLRASDNKVLVCFCKDLDGNLIELVEELK